MFYKILITLLISISFCFSISFDELETYKANFVQTITKTDDTKIVYKGEVFIKKPSNILWKYKEPVVKNVYLNDDMIVIDEPMLEQAIFTRINKDINFIEVLKNAKKIEGNNYETSIDNKVYNIVLRDGVLQKLEYLDDVENKIEIKFLNVSVNTPIKDEAFRFMIPDGYDIIRK